MRAIGPAMYAVAIACPNRSEAIDTEPVSGGHAPTMMRIASLILSLTQEAMPDFQCPADGS